MFLFQSRFSDDGPHPALKLECVCASECEGIKFLECHKTPKSNFFKAKHEQISADLANMNWRSALLHYSIKTRLEYNINGKQKIGHGSTDAVQRELN